MNQKTTLVLVAALILAGVGVWVASPNKDKKEPDNKKPEPKKLLEPAPKDLTAVEIDVPGKTSVAFAKVDAKWRLTAPFKAPAATATVDSAANAVRDLTYVASFKPSDPDKPSEELTGLAKAARVKLTDADNKVFIVKLGNDVPAARQTYAQKEGDDAIYVVTGDPRRGLDRDLKEFREPRVDDFNVPDATKIEVSGEERYTLARAGDAWTFEAPFRGRADKNTVESLLRSASTLNAMAFVDDAPKKLTLYGLEPPSARVVITVEKKVPKPTTQPAGSTQPAPVEFETQTRTIPLAFGAVVKDMRFVKLDTPETPWVVQVPEAAAKNVLQQIANLREKNVAKLDINRASRISVAGPNGNVDLAKNNNVWEFASGAPTSSKSAEFAAVDDFLRSIRDLVATGYEPAGDSLQDYGFKPARLNIAITTDGMIEPIRLSVGKPTPSGTGFYVKNENENSVAVVKSDAAEALVVSPMYFASRDMLRFDRNRVGKLELTRGLRSVSLENKNGAWMLTAPVAAPADAAVVSNIVSDLSTLRARRVVGSKTQLAAFHLAEPQIFAVLTINPPTPPSTQSSQPASQPTAPPEILTVACSKKDGKAYAIVAGADSICEVDPRVFDDLDAELLDKRIFPAGVSNALSVAIARDGSPAFTFDKKDDQWSLAGEATFPADTTKVAAVVSALTELKAQKYVSYDAKDLAAFGLDKPALAITLKLADGESREFRVSAKGPEGDTTGQRFATLIGSGRVFLINKEEIAKLDKDVKSFQK